MLIVHILLFFLPLTNCQYLNEDEVEIILSIAENQFIKHLIIAIEKPQRVIRYGIKKILKEKYFLTILDISYIEDYINYAPVAFHKSFIIIKEDFSRINLAVAEDKISSYTWIVFSTKENSNSRALLRAYIPYNALLLLVLKINEKFYDIIEIYNPDYKDPRIQFRNLFGIWARHEKLFIEIPEFYKRRLNLEKTTFIITAMPTDKSPFYESSMYELWQDLKKVMNFTYIYVKRSYLKENDMQPDAYITPATIVASSFIPDLVGPIFTNNLYMHIKDDINYKYDWTSIFKPFSRQLWIYLTIWLIISGIFLMIYERRKKEEIRDIFGAGLSPLDVLCGQWALDDRKSFSWRIAIFFILTSGLIYSNSYTSIFTSFLTVPDPQLPFRDLQGFIKDGTYLIESSNNFMDEYIKILISNMTQNAESFILKEKVNTLQSGVKRLCSNEKLVSVLANNMGIIYEQYFGLCKIFRIPKPILKEYLFFPLRICSPYKEIFNMFFMSARSVGVLKYHEIRIEKMDGVLNEKMIPSLHDSDNFDFTATISQLVSVLKIIIFGWLTSLIIFILELISRAIRNKINRKIEKGHLGQNIFL